VSSAVCDVISVVTGFMVSVATMSEVCLQQYVCGVEWARVEPISDVIHQCSDRVHVQQYVCGVEWAAVEPISDVIHQCSDRVHVQWYVCGVEWARVEPIRDQRKRPNCFDGAQGSNGRIHGANLGTATTQAAKLR
jgi:hypothetical protein